MSYRRKLPQNWNKQEYKKWKIDVGIRLFKEIERKYGSRKMFVFAEEVGISQGSLSEIINGISLPCAHTLIKIMNNTNISAEYLLGVTFVRRGK